MAWIVGPINSAYWAFQYRSHNLRMTQLNFDNLWMIGPYNIDIGQYPGIRIAIANLNNSNRYCILLLHVLASARKNRARLLPPRLEPPVEVRSRVASMAGPGGSEQQQRCRAAAVCAWRQRTPSTHGLFDSFISHNTGKAPHSR